jgi:outer membrane protein assembly factor BamA
MRPAKVLSQVLLLICFCKTVLTSYGQQTTISFVPALEASFIKESGLITHFASNVAAKQYLTHLAGDLQAKGYASASVDSFWEKADTLFIALFTGEQYRWSNLHFRKDDSVFLESLGINESTLRGKLFTQESVAFLLKKIVEADANLGYPFASVALDSLFFENGKVSGWLNINHGRLYFIDSIIVEGDIRLSTRFIQDLLDIHAHSPFSQKKIDKINERLQSLTWLRQSRSYDIEMLNTGAILRLYLEGTKSNQINALIGLLPNNGQQNGGLLLTGEATVVLQNLFSGGEHLNMVWQQLQPSSPRLQMQYTQPFLFRLPFGISAGFELYKRDSLFLNIKSQLGIQFDINEKQSGIVALQSFRTNVLFVDTNIVKITGQLPLLSDVNTRGLTFQYRYSNTDYRFNPRKGNDLQFMLGVSQKELRKNNTIQQIDDPLFDIEKLYESVEKNTYYLRFQTIMSHYFALGRQSTLKIGAQAGWIQSSSYFQNELFQVGGFKLMRGFDEEALFANRYLVGNIEYRYLLDKNSRLFAFVDLGQTFNQAILEQRYNQYVGVGAGLSFETKTGILSFSLAVGKQNSNSFDTQQAKIHFGFVSLF